MICTFFGHRDSSFAIRERLEEVISELILQGVSVFLVGNNGNFDCLVQTVLADMAKNNLNITARIVLSCIDEKAISGKQELTIFPEELSSVPRKFAISKRNEYMLKRALVVVANVSNTVSCSYKWLEKAKKGGKKIVNLC